VNEARPRKEVRGDVLLREQEVVENLLGSSGMEETIAISTLKGKLNLTQQK